MFEYSDSLGQLFRVISFFLVIGLPVFLNRLFSVKYPLAILTLMVIHALIFVLLGLVSSILFNIEHAPSALDGLLFVIASIMQYLIALFIDYTVYKILNGRKV